MFNGSAARHVANPEYVATTAEAGLACPISRDRDNTVTGHSLPIGGIFGESDRWIMVYRYIL